MLIAEVSGARRSSYGSYVVCKRLLDVGLASLAILVLSPLLLAIVAAIRLTSPGPALFQQKRYGYRSRLFRVYKFRTMYLDRSDQSGVQQTRRFDSRITPVGRFLRRTNLDELPQLINVLKGDMSLVGPRPHVPGMLAGGIPYEQLVPFYFERHDVQPGITGLAQACGLRGDTRDPRPAIERIHYDLAYARNRSMSLDLKILWCTLRGECAKCTGL